MNRSRLKLCGGKMKDIPQDAVDSAGWKKYMGKTNKSVPSKGEFEPTVSEAILSSTRIVHASGLLTEDEAADVLRIKPQTLAVWRSTKCYSLRYIKVGHLVRYRLEDLQAFLRERTHER
jgi:hypothetical protein